MIVDQAYWDDAYEGYRFTVVPEEDPIKELIRTFLPPAGPGMTAFEPGCFPGRYLREVGRLGYELHGCDLTPRTEELVQWLRQEGCRVGSMERRGFETVSSSQQYDVVGSFGFIEHFENVEEIFSMHCDLIRPGGILLLEFPNFHGLLQRGLRHWLDRDNLENHVLRAMDVATYRKCIPEGFDVLFCGYIGRFEIWFDDFNRRNGPMKQKLTRWIPRVLRPLRWLPPHHAYAPYGAVVLRRSP